jgi:hypothetical protein
MAALDSLPCCAEISGLRHLGPPPTLASYSDRRLGDLAVV